LRIVGQSLADHQKRDPTAKLLGVFQERFLPHLDSYVVEFSVKLRTVPSGLSFMQETLVLNRILDGRWPSDKIVENVRIVF